MRARDAPGWTARRRRAAQRGISTLPSPPPLDDWSTERAILLTRGITLAPGLSDAELIAIERLHGFRFPPDLRAFLRAMLPTGDRFPDWRNPQSPALAASLAWPLTGILFDIEHNKLWLQDWGPRPEALPEAFTLARSRVEQAPRLIPVYGHRYIPASPELEGNPVYSVYQTDIIFYGANLRLYFAHEFGGLLRQQALRARKRRIPFWSRFIGL